MFRRRGEFGTGEVEGEPVQEQEGILTISQLDGIAQLSAVLSNTVATQLNGGVVRLAKRNIRHTR